MDRYFEVACNIDPDLAFGEFTRPLIELVADSRLRGLQYYVLQIDTAKAKMLDYRVWEVLVTGWACALP